MAATLFFAGFTYVFLLDKANYLNHFYLIALISFVMILVPAHRSFSVDARINPALRSSTVPAWALWLVRFQVGIAYFYAGIAKLNSRLAARRAAAPLAARLDGLPADRALVRRAGGRRTCSATAGWRWT